MLGIAPESPASDARFVGHFHGIQDLPTKKTLLPTRYKFSARKIATKFYWTNENSIYQKIDCRAQVNLKTSHTKQLALRKK
jgi:hypothetical protein